MDKVGDRLYKIRLERNLSQEQLGEKIGVSRQTVSMWEANRRKINLDKLKLLCEVLEVAPEYFLLDNDKNMSLESSGDVNHAVACAETEEKQEKKKLSKTNKVLIIIMVIVAIIGIFSAIVVKMCAHNDAEAFQELNSATFNFDELFWLIPGVAGLVVVIVVAKLIKINLKRRK